MKERKYVAARAKYTNRVALMSVNLPKVEPGLHVCTDHSESREGKSNTLNRRRRRYETAISLRLERIMIQPHIITEVSHAD